MSGASTSDEEAVRLSLVALADLERLRDTSRPLLAIAATRASAVLAQALAVVAPGAFEQREVAASPDPRGLLSRAQSQEMG